MSGKLPLPFDASILTLFSPYCPDYFLTPLARDNHSLQHQSHRTIVHMSIKGKFNILIHHGAVNLGSRQPYPSGPRGYAALFLPNRRVQYDKLSWGYIFTLLGSPLGEYLTCFARGSNSYHLPQLLFDKAKRKRDSDLSNVIYVTPEDRHVRRRLPKHNFNTASSGYATGVSSASGLGTVLTHPLKAPPLLPARPDPPIFEYNIDRVLSQHPDIVALLNFLAVELSNVINTCAWHSIMVRNSPSDHSDRPSLQFASNFCQKFRIQIFFHQIPTR